MIARLATRLSSVFPSRPYQDESHDENKVILTGDSMFVGNYCPFESDEDIFTGQDGSGLETVMNS